MFCYVTISVSSRYVSMFGLMENNKEYDDDNDDDDDFYEILL